MGYKILERIKSVVAEKKITQRDISQGMKMSVTTVNKILNNEDELSLYMIGKLSDFLGVNDKWIITGTGSKYLKQGETDVIEDESLNFEEELQNLREKLKRSEADLERLKIRQSNNSSTDKANDFIGARFIDSRSMKTYPQNYDDESFLSKLPVYPMMSSRFANKAYRVFEIVGEEMNHKIVDGDWVIGEKVEDFKSIKDMFAYIVVLDQEVVCRRVLNRVKERGRLRLKCDNKFFRDKEINIEEVKEVWEVKSIQSFSLANPYFHIEDWMKKMEDKMFELEDKVDRL